MSTTLRTATVLDCTSIARMVHEAWPNNHSIETTAAKISSALDRRAAEGQHTFVAETEGVAVGTVTVHVRTRMKGLKRDATIHDMVVSKEWRGKGVGTRIMAEAVRVATEEFGCRWVEVTPETEKLEEFYRRVGFARGPWGHIMYTRQH